MDAKKKKNLEETYQRILNVGFCIVPYEDISEIIGPDPMVYGTAKDERILSFEGVEALFKSQFEQMGNMKPAIDRKRIALRISNGGNNACIIEELTFTLSSDEEIHTIFMRATCVMEYLDNQWKITHWHTSTPVDTENDPWHMEEWKREKEKLQRLVDEQTVALKQNNRELQIEAALEKIRSSSLAMKKTEDLGDVVKVLFEQMQGLSVDMGFASVSIFIFENGSRNIRQWLPLTDGVSSLGIPYFDHPISSDLFDAKENGADYFEKVYTLEEKNTWLELGFELTDYKDLPEEFKSSLFQAPGYAIAITLAKNSGICIPSFVGILPSPEDVEIMKRVGKVFEQAYIRFLDLQKAEAQAREAQIEAALERVRSKSLAMHKTAELQSVIHTVHQELLNLNLSISGGSFIVINKEIENDLLCWGSGGTADTSDIVHIPHFEKPFYTHLLNKIKSDPGFFTEEYTNEEKIEFFSFLFQHEPWSNLDSKQKEETLSAPGGYTRSCIVSKHTSIFIINHFGAKFSEAENAILSRFGKVFEQSYTRFLDLQKAEAQAREAQIEAALERVRAQTMAMHSSEDVGKCVVKMFAELTALGVDEGTRFGIGILNHDNENNQLWTARKDGEEVNMHIGHLDMSWHPLLKSAREAWKAQVPIHKYVLEGEDLLAYYEMLNTAPDYKIQIPLEKLPKKEIQHCFIFEHGFFYAFTPIEFQPDLIQITKRFSSLFEQTYRRYLDLVKAEAQAREAQIETALERIRSRTMGMQTSEELADVAFVLFKQLRTLGGNLWGTGFGLCQKDSDLDSFWFANENGVFPPVCIPNTTDSAHKQMFEGWKTGKDFLAIEASDEDLKSHYDYLLSLPEVKPFFQKILDEGLSFPNWQQWNAAYFKQGYLLIIMLEPYPDSEILKRFAKVFEQTYTRFLDLQKAEAQAREAEIELALERVRARTMAMQHSDELTEASEVLDQQVRSLGIETWGCAFHIYADDPQGDHEWFSSREGNLPFYKTPREKFFLKFYEKGQAGEIFHVEEFIGEDCKAHYDFLMTIPVMGDVLSEIVASGASLPESQYDHIAFFNHGYILFITYEPVPESHAIFQRFAKVFEQTYTRFLDLQKAEAQAREAKIEAALEKIRSRTMGMQSSDELPVVANLLFTEVRALGIHAWSCGYNILAEDRKSATCCMSSEGTLQTPFQLRLWGEASFDEMGDFIHSNEIMLVQELGGKALESHYAYMKSFPDLKPTFDEIERLGLSLPTYQINHLCKFNQGFILFITYEKVPDAHDIFKRFTRVFDQTYTRFLDLKKAEAQAREAKIEVALEKVRSRTMGMQKSDELADVANVLFQEMNELVHNLWTCGFVLCEKDRQEDEWWLSLEDGFTRGFFLPNVNDYAHAHLYEGWLKKDDFRTAQLEGEKLQDHYNWLMEIPIAKTIFDDMEAAGMQRPEWQKLHAAYFSKGYLVIITREPCPEEVIFKRFAQVFDLTYTRFLDLKKAEEQARESQIEASLEKVRSRSLAMQSPVELIEVAQLLREEMGALGVEELETSSIYIHDENSGLTQCWFTIKNTNDPAKAVTDQMAIDLQDTWVGRQMLDFYRSPENQTSILMQGANRKAWIQYCEEKTDLFGTSNFYGDTIPERTYHLYKFSNGYIGAAAPGEISKESWDLLKRATAVFSFAYTRFQDLQNAEASAIAAMRQASLDRIRADISSMRNADDLDRITPLIFKELTVLGVPFIRCGVFIIHEKEEIVEAYLSSPDGISLGVLKLPYHASELTYQTVEAWRKGLVYRQHWNKEDFIQWIEQLMEQDQIQDSRTYQGTAVPPESLDLHFVPFAQGMLYVGALSPLDEMELELVQALAKAFSIAFARYEDFVKLDKAKSEVESAMSELKATQSQLVQQEKLASLGQLTAGIAHEIKNPLNFVNNFSEVSIEMIEEVLEARSERRETRSQRQETKSCPENREDKNQEGEWDESEEIEDEILEDIKANLKKIHEHGSRANGIVTSMLQHSRGGTGKKEPTDINALIKEYSNLAFHGMRAGKNPINAAIDLQLDEQIRYVPLVSEDFSRVLLNLCNNAFDAMRITAEIRPPKLSIRTKLQSEKILIEVEDNGAGIPDEIKDKILQPFFTTKKGTEGTGLGLSITHDIIKAHGGQLDIQSQPGSTIFKIYLTL
jgi:signal transduction histidine kinase